MARRFERTNRFFVHARRTHARMHVLLTQAGKLVGTDTRRHTFGPSHSSKPSQSQPRAQPPPPPRQFSTPDKRPPSLPASPLSNHPSAIRQIQTWMPEFGNPGPLSSVFLPPRIFSISPAFYGVTRWKRTNSIFNDILRYISRSSSARTEFKRGFNPTPIGLSSLCKYVTRVTSNVYAV